MHAAACRNCSNSLQKALVIDIEAKRPGGRLEIVTVDEERDPAEF